MSYCSPLTLKVLVRFAVALLGVGLLPHSATCQEVYCPGQTAISCSATAPVAWTGTAFVGQCPLNGTVLQDSLTVDNIGNTFTCGVFTVTVTNVETAVQVGVTVTIISSSLMFNADSTLDGRTIRCGTVATSTPDVDLELIVPDNIPTPTLSLSESSLTAVTMNVMVDDIRCASQYFVEITEISSSSQPIIRSSSTPSVNVSGLDLCGNRYSAVGYVQAPNGATGPRSSNVIIPSGIEGVWNVTIASKTSSILEWTQLPNSARPDCITGYIISWPGGQGQTADSSTSINVGSLNGFPYCETVTVTVTVNTPNGAVSTSANSSSVFFQHPEFDDPSVTAMISLQNGNTLMIDIKWQDISVDAVPFRYYGLVNDRDGNECVPQTPVTGSSVTQPVPGAQSGDNYTVCVMFVNKGCNESTSIPVTVPVRVFSDVLPAAAGDGFSVTVTLLSSTPMGVDPSTLSILSTIDPPHASAVLADYPTTSSQYTVTFSGLTPGTTYTLDIRVVLRSDTTNTVGLPVIGSYAVPALSACALECIVGIVLGAGVTVIALMAIVVVITLLMRNKALRNKRKCARSTVHGPVYEDPDDVKPDPHTEGNLAYGHVQHTGRQQSSQPPTELRGQMYEEPENFKPDPHTQGNVAYGQVQF